MARLAAVTGAILFFALCHVTMSITVQDFFQDIKGNLTKLKWAHRTNSLAELTKVLNSTEVQMIEADVIMGKLKNATEPAVEIPIMGHPPETDSDLSLEAFIEMVLVNKKKGIKLDFKNITAFKDGLVILKKNANLTQIPVWLNADILKGPVNAIVEPVSAKEFLTGAAELPQAMLSIGWTTRLEEGKVNVTTSIYTMDQINEMIKLVNTAASADQSVTYPVRACFAANDVVGLDLLLNSTAGRNATLTIWSSSEDDPVNPTLLSQVIKRIGLDKVYLDVPASLFAKLDLSNSAGSAKSSFIVLLCAMIVAITGSRIL